MAGSTPLRSMLCRMSLLCHLYSMAKPGQVAQVYHVAYSVKLTVDVIHGEHVSFYLTRNLEQ